MRKLAIGVLLSFAVLVTGCSVMKRMGGQVAGSGNVKNEIRNVPAFTSVSTSGAFTVDIVCQKERSLTIEADDNLLPLVTTEVKGGTLYVDTQKSYSSKKPIVIRISAPDIDAISTSGAGDFTVTNVKNKAMRIDISGAATIKASGETDNLTVKMSGAGNVSMGDLKAKDVDVSMSGAGNADVYASNKLDADISGAGSVTYAGDPPTVNKNVSGIGSIAKK